MANKDMTQLNVAVVDDQLTITIGLKQLETALNGAKFSGLKVTDIDSLLPDFISELKSTDESGSTMIDRMFDDAANKAAESGASGVEFLEV